MILKLSSRNRLTLAYEDRLALAHENSFTAYVYYVNPEPNVLKCFNCVFSSCDSNFSYRHYVHMYIHDLCVPSKLRMHYVWIYIVKTSLKSIRYEILMLLTSLAEVLLLFFFRRVKDLNFRYGGFKYQVIFSKHFTVRCIFCLRSFYSHTHVSKQLVILCVDLVIQYLAYLPKLLLNYTTSFSKLSNCACVPSYLLLNYRNHTLCANEVENINTKPYLVNKYSGKSTVYIKRTFDEIVNQGLTFPP